jgi:hypothetical protein
VPIDSARTHSRSQNEPHLALRVVLTGRGARWANCVFAGEPLAEAAGAGSPLRDQFAPGEPIWGRCYFPSQMALPKLALIDRVFADGHKQPIWEQAYPEAAPSALSRSLDYSEVLRMALAGLPRGLHRIRVEGLLRRGTRDTMLYRGEFRYVR